MVYAMVLFPLFMAGIAAAIPMNRVRPWLLPFSAVIHFSLTVLVLVSPELAHETGWFVLDPVGKVILLVVDTLVLFSSFYAVGYLMQRLERSNRFFIAGILGFLGLTSVVTWSHHLGVTWVAIEGTTLVTAPLIYFNRTKTSIEATWRYLLVGSVGIALALLGTFFLAYALLRQGITPSLLLEDLVPLSPELSKPWLRAAFILLLIGFGTKMGLAPMHTWKPDAYGEAPAVVGAILAGGVTSCAFLAFLRVYQICLAAGEGAFASRILLYMGLFSMAVAGLFMVGQRDFKRLLAYSSVEHMGILIFGLGVGAPALFGTLLHVMMNALTKGVLFLSAGNIHRAYNSRNIGQVHGAFRRLPVSGILFFLGFLAITASPPFGPFVSIFAIVTGAFDAGKTPGAVLFLLFLLLVFFGMGRTVLAVTLGESPSRESQYRDTFLTAAPIILVMALVLALGLYLPTPLTELLQEAVSFMEKWS